MTSTRDSRIRARLTGLAAVVAILAILAGLPALLLAVGGLPDGFPSLRGVVDALTRPDDGTLAVTAFVVLGWLTWLVLAVALLAELAAALRGHTARALPGLALPQGTARILVASAALLFATAPIVTPTTAASSAAFTPADVPVTVMTAAAGAAPAHVAGPAGTTTPAVPTPTHVVQRGDSLWSIAAETLGSGRRYPEIVALNRDVLGTHPDFLLPGTTLRLPPPATTTEPRPQAQPGAAPDYRYVVHEGDTLWDIAEARLGDPHRYPEIVEASRDIRQPGGAHLTDPDVIDIGWTLAIPDTPTPAPQKVAAGPDAQRAKTPGPADGTAGPGKPAGAPAPESENPSKATSPSAPSSGDTSPTMRPGEGAQPERQRSAPLPHVTSSTAEVADDGSVTPAWLLTGLAGGGGILAGSLFLALRSRRRAQFRARRPGRTISVPGVELAPVEKTVTVTGEATSVAVECLDEVLRRLAAAHASTTRAMPGLAAVEISATTLALHLGAAGELPTPWEGSDDGRVWRLPLSADPGDVGPQVPDQPAPYPLLVTVGSADTGQTWLLNCEQLTPLTITGDAAFGHDFARYLTAELACNPWSSGVSVHCLGVAEDLVALNPDRIHAAGDVDAISARVLEEALTMQERAGREALDVPTARAGQVGAEPWHATVLLVDDDCADDRVHQLGALLREHPGATATALVLTSTAAKRGAVAGVEVHVSDTGRVTIPELGLDLVAVGLTPDEAQGCAALLAQADTTDDTPIPVEPQGDGWKSLADEAGSIRVEHTLPRAELARPDRQGDLACSSILELRDEDYLEAAATTGEDLERLAPAVPGETRARVEEIDPDLDVDLDTWFSDRCDLPRLTLLGPVRARTRGVALTKRKPYYTELLTYLATRPHGVTPDELAEAFSLTTARVRNDVKIVRDWLGVNPRTGRKHLPDAREAPAAKERGVAAYQVEGLLTDIDLFRRLRLRGESRGPAGIVDLRRALTLVDGRPFDRLRPGGWSWLLEGDRLDHHLLCAVVDVAHMVTTHSLAGGDHRTARAAAELACLAAPYDEIPRLDLAAVAAAEGHHEEADRIAREDICARAEQPGPPDDLPDRTQRILEQHAWLRSSKTAS